MKKKTKSLQYCLEKERFLWQLYILLGMGISIEIFGIILSIEDKEMSSDLYIVALFISLIICYLLYANFTKIKRRILSKHGIKHDAEIVNARYGSPGIYGFPSYYLEIDFINSKGKRKTLYTAGYHDNPNYYLESAKCFVYEWKGFYVEADFQMRDEIDYFGYTRIPTEKKRFIWR